MTYAAALSGSAGLTYNGAQGHLVTISSAGENSFVTGLLSNSWVAIDDLVSEGTYKYSAGPESGMTISYSAWGPGQPDNYNNEDCVTLWSTLALPNNWNDLSCTALVGYVVEYECASGSVFSGSACQGIDCFTTSSIAACMIDCMFSLICCCEF